MRDPSLAFVAPAADAVLEAGTEGGREGEREAEGDWRKATSSGNWIARIPVSVTAVAAAASRLLIKYLNKDEGPSKVTGKKFL